MDLPLFCNSFEITGSKYSMTFNFYYLENSPGHALPEKVLLKSIVVDIETARKISAALSLGISKSDNMPSPQQNKT